MELLDSPTCLYRDSVETIEHHFFYCTKSTKFCNNVVHVTAVALNLKINFIVCEILFGFHLQMDPSIKCIKFLILLGKWFLNKKKTMQSPIMFKEFLHFVKSKLEILYLVHQNERSIESFNIIFSNFLNFLQQ